MGRMGGSKLAALLTVMGMIALAVFLMFGSKQSVQAGSGARSPHVQEIEKAVHEAERHLGRR